MKSGDLDLSTLGRVSGLLSAALASIDDHQWALTTPCDDWDLSGLVDHITGGNWFTSRILAGQAAEDAMAETIELFGNKPTTSDRAVGSVDELLTAFQQPGVLDRICHHVAGDLTGRQALRLRLHDLIVHTWDVSQTISPPAALPDDVLSWAVAELADGQSLAATHFGLAEIPTVDNDEAGTNYLSRFGR